MKFQQLEAIAKKYTTGNLAEFPVNAFEIAKQLNLRVKNSIECKKDFKDNYPLYNCNAVYTLVNGEYTIYYDEKYAYKNFSVAHEIAHHLLEHCSDGVREHHDANLLAAILLLPPDSISQNNIKNAVDLSEKYLIPCSVACEYWVEIKDTIKGDFKIFTIKNIAIILVAVFTLMVIFTCLTYNFPNPSDTKQEELFYSDLATSPTPEDDTQNSKLSSSYVEQLYYATPSGKRFHIKDCRYIKYKTNTIELSFEEIAKLNLTPCKVCIK